MHRGSVLLDKDSYERSSRPRSTAVHLYLLNELVNMNVNPSKTAPSQRLVDAIMDSYVKWREASVGVDVAYGNWTHAGFTERALAFHGYWAALDREEAAAREYRRLVEQAGA